VERLARHHNLSYEDAKQAFTKEEHGRKYAMRRKKDPVFGKICRFFDIKKRSCTIYEARPAVCRSFPGGEGKWQISNAGGVDPVWTKGGREIVYQVEDGGFFAVPISADEDLRPGTPVPPPRPAQLNAGPALAGLRRRPGPTPKLRRSRRRKAGGGILR